MKQRLGAKKHRKCEAATGKTYTSCWTRGGWDHFWAECLLPSADGYGPRNSDNVNWITGEARPCFRDGRLVAHEEANEVSARSAPKDSSGDPR